jgi:hypothetical protein
LPVHASYKIAKRLYAKGRDADGVFIPCPRWPTITDVQLLEDEIGKPVITSSLACSWYAMRLIDIKENVKGFGRLMESLASGGNALVANSLCYFLKLLRLKNRQANKEGEKMSWIKAAFLTGVLSSMMVNLPRIVWPLSGHGGRAVVVVNVATD